MKKYSTSEAIAMLAEKPELRFKDSLGSIMTTSKTTKKIVWEKNDTQREEDFIIFNYAFGCDNLHIEWELVQQPVSFMEAVKAYSEGKTIRCEISRGNYTYKPSECVNTDYGYKIVTQDLHSAITTGEILNGTWFVEV